MTFLGVSGVAKKLLTIHFMPSDATVLVARVAPLSDAAAFTGISIDMT